MRERNFVISKDKKQTSQTLLRGLRLLDLIGEGRSSLSTRELAEIINLPKSVVHRLILTLEGEGYLQRNSVKPGYSLGTKLWWLGCAAIQGLEIKDVAHQHLESLASKTNELVVLGVLDEREVIYLDKIDCLQPVRAYIAIGGRVPAYCSSTGKAILAYLNNDDLSEIVSSMKKFTSKTVTGMMPFQKHLMEIRRRGYSVNEGEWHEDVGGVAAAVLDRDGNALAAIGITLPIHRLTAENIDRLGSLTVRTAAAVSEGLGYGGSEKRRVLK